MKMKKNYFNTIVSTIFCLLVLGYSKSSYAEIEKYFHILTCHNVIVSKCIGIGDSDESTEITLTLAKELVQLLKEQEIDDVRLHAPFNPGTAEIIIPALLTHKSLRAFDIYWIDKKWAMVVADALQKNRPLSTLVLNYCSIGNEGARAIAKALRTNSTLTYLDLSSNDIGYAGAQEIVKTLRVNNTLQRIYITGNDIGVDGIRAIVEALVHNITLQRIAVDWDRDSQEESDLEKATDLILKRNRLFANLMQRVINNGSSSSSSASTSSSMISSLQSCDNKKFYNMIMSDTKEKLLQYLTTQDLWIVNELRGLQINILKHMSQAIPQELFQYFK
jgi:hypothetical protein